jgi:hypothetical protein
MIYCVSKSCVEDSSIEWEVPGVVAGQRIVAESGSSLRLSRAGPVRNTAEFSHDKMSRFLLPVRLLSIIPASYEVLND